MLNPFSIRQSLTLSVFRYLRDCSLVFSESLHGTGVNKERVKSVKIWVFGNFPRISLMKSL